MIRDADINDLDRLVELENACFETDRLSRRSFRHIITRGRAITLVEEENGRVRGYAMVLYRAGVSLARLYSIAVDPEGRNHGIGRTLLEAAEERALSVDCVYMRLELRPDNPSAIALYTRMGYRRFGTYDDYYEDHMWALRYEKVLVPNLAPDLVRVPYYEQTLDFTCGPAVLMMAMKALDRNLELSRKTEIRLWRESTTVFMTSGHGGCGPMGMALAAHRRGFEVEVFVNRQEAMFVDSVRSEEKKEVIRLVHEDFAEELASVPIAVHYQPLSLREMKERFKGGAIPIVLISSYRIYSERFPHWVVVTGFDDRYVYVHDPFVDYEKGKERIDCINMPILIKDFVKMTAYGKPPQMASLAVSRRRKRKGTGNGCHGR